MSKKILFLFVFLLATVLSLVFNEQKLAKPEKKIYDKSIKTENGKPIKVAEVVDGDTVTLINGDRLRYVGIDTPEEFDERKPVQCFAKEAALHNRELVEGKTITFYKDISVKDSYGRWLGFVYLEDGTFVNEKMIKDGFGFSYPYQPDTSKSEVFMEAENYAQKNNLGLWSSCTVSRMKGGRAQTNPVE